jgi:hypothetical protein
MSLKPRTQNSSDPNLASLSDYQSLLTKELHSIPKLDSSFPPLSDSQLFSSSNDSKLSIEVEGLCFSQELEKILAKHLKQSSVVEKSVKNTYDGILTGFVPSPEPICPKTNAEVKKTTSHKPISPRLKTLQTSLRDSTFALASRIYCMKCAKEVSTTVSYQLKSMSWWNSLGFYLDLVRCCGEPRALSRYQELVHSCSHCNSVVARICTN